MADKHKVNSVSESMEDVKSETGRWSPSNIWGGIPVMRQEDSILLLCTEPDATNTSFRVFQGAGREGSSSPDWHTCKLLGAEVCQLSAVRTHQMQKKTQQKKHLIDKTTNFRSSHAFYPHNNHLFVWAGIRCASLCSYHKRHV